MIDKYIGILYNAFIRHQALTRIQKWGLNTHWTSNFKIHHERRFPVMTIWTDIPLKQIP